MPDSNWTKAGRAEAIRSIEGRLRLLAAKLSGVEMGHRLSAGDHGPARYVVIEVVQEDGTTVDLSEDLLDLADEVAQLEWPRVR